MANPVLKICTYAKRRITSDSSKWEVANPYYLDFVDLLDLKGWLLKEWSPAVPEPKSGGIFRGSPLVNGRALAYRKMDNITDTFNLVGSSGSQDMLIASIKRLQRILEKATEYWTTSWQDEPVWIEARGPMESESRYCTIVDYRLSGFGGPYQQPFFGGCNSASEAILVIEHAFWQDSVPGQRGNCVELKSRTDYPGIATYASGYFEPAQALADVTYDTLALTCDSTGHTLGIGFVSPFRGKAEAGIIFENVSIPEDSVIKSATLRVKVNSIALNTNITVKGQSQQGGSIDSVTLVSGGMNYNHPRVDVYSSMSGVGAGAVIVASVCDPESSADCSQTGEIFELTIVNPGYGYVNPVIVITDEGCTMPPCGSGAVATCTASPVGVGAALFDGTNDDFLGRPRTNNRVDKSFTTLMGSSSVDIDVTYIVREITSSEYWSSGDNLGMFLSLKEGTSTSGGMAINSYDEGADIPRLIVEWSSDVAPLGRDTTCAQEVFVSNKHNSAPVKYMFSYDDSAVSKWSPNMFEWDFTNDLPLFQSDSAIAIVPAADDAIYFGSCPSGAYDLDYGPFSSLVFDIAHAQTGISAGVWEYWDGATWRQFLVAEVNYLCGDNTIFDKTGVTSIVFNQPANWATTTINGLLGYWVRFRVTSASGATTPYQWHRDIYTVNNPYIDIASSRVPGDMPALAKINFDSAACPERSMNTLVLGLRSLIRGEDFDAYLNASDKQNPLDTEFTIVDTDAHLQDSSKAPTGRMVDLTGFAPDDVMTEICNWSVGSFAARQYIGVYHAFVRCEFGTTSVGVVKFRLKAVFGDEYNVTYSDIGCVSLGLNKICAIDLGQFYIVPPYDLHPGDSIDKVKISLESCTNTDVNSTSYYTNNLLYDIVLIPADEWSGNFGMPKITGTSVLTYNYGVEIDGISTPRQYRAMEFRKTKFGSMTLTKSIVAEWSRIASGEPILQANSDQRLWFFQYQFQDGLVSNFENCGSVCAERSSRYLLMRGNE